MMGSPGTTARMVSKYSEITDSGKMLSEYTPGTQQRGFPRARATGRGFPPCPGYNSEATPAPKVPFPSF